MKADAPRAWQPLTFGGVARYGHDWVGRLFAVCVIVSLVVAAAVVWTARRAWNPVIEQAMANLPPGVELRGGELKMPPTAGRLAENSFLALQLDPRRGAYGRPSGSSDIQITLAPDEIRFHSLFGRTSAPYQPQWTLVLSSAEMDPWWSAWRPAMLGYLAAGAVLFLFPSWIGMGVLNGALVFLLARIAKRDLSLWGSWKVAVAALMPGAIFQSIALVFYGLGNLRLPELLGAFALHFFIGWMFAALAVFWLPKQEGAENPFDGDEDEEGAGDAGAKKKTRADPPPQE